MDFLTVRQRSRHMSKIRGKNTKLERTLFELLQNRNVAFETHVSNLRGRPDVVFRHFQLAVFVDGDFWHGRHFRRWKNKLNSFWRHKIEANIRRDKRTDRRLRAQGWSILHVWGSDLLKRPDRCLSRILTARNRRSKVIRGSV